MPRLIQTWVCPNNLKRQIWYELAHPALFPSTINSLLTSNDKKTPAKFRVCSLLKKSNITKEIKRDSPLFYFV